MLINIIIITITIITITTTITISHLIARCLNATYVYMTLSDVDVHDN